MAQHGKENIEEQFLLRVQDPELAQTIRKTLRDEGQLCNNLELNFEVVESYKTLDDHNLVKSADIGQMLLVQPKDSPTLDIREAPDGVTPTMKNGRQRWFRPIPEVDPPVMAKVEQQVLSMLSGNAPDGWQINDVEEVYEVDETTKQGSWKPVPKK